MNKYHHNPSGCVSENAEIIEIIHISDLISYGISEKFGIDGQYYKPSIKIFNKFNMDKKAQDKLKKDIKESYTDFLKTILNK